MTPSFKIPGPQGTDTAASVLKAVTWTQAGPQHLRSTASLHKTQAQLEQLLRQDARGPLNGEFCRVGQDGIAELKGPVVELLRRQLTVVPQREGRE